MKAYELLREVFQFIFFKMVPPTYEIIFFLVDPTRVDIASLVESSLFQSSPWPILVVKGLDKPIELIHTGTYIRMFNKK